MKSTETQLQNAESVLARCRELWDERARRPLTADENDGYPDTSYLGRYADIIEKLKPDRRITLLDVGCGRGTVLRHVRDAFLHVVGVDISARNLTRLMEELGSMEVYQGSAHGLPFPNANFGRVLLYGVLHYMPNWHAASAVVAELIRVCKPGGYVVVGDNEPTVNTAFDPPIEKKPVNPSQSRPGDMYLCFTEEFFKDSLVPDGHRVLVADTWGQPGHFDVIVEVRRNERATTRPKDALDDRLAAAPGPPVIHT